MKPVDSRLGRLRGASLFLLSFVLFSGSAVAQREFSANVGDTSVTMKEYFLCFLKKGPRRDQDSVTREVIQRNHLAHLGSLARAGKVCIAGPVGDEGDLQGIIIFTVATKEEAERLEAQDPAVKAGRLIVEVHSWWGAKGSLLR